jgi:nitroimidazol reductase NimA-like FMN-containing flavoprotein (pyridoxamine 5'-phosphate oxidase superfamily)
MPDELRGQDRDYPATERTRIRREHERGTHERAAVHAILDASPLCHVGYSIDGAPFVTPTLQWRDGDRVYWHGSAASRFLRQASGTQVCLTCTLMDGYVLARSAFNHSVNYRSAMVFGLARLIEDEAEKQGQLQRFTETLFPGRWDSLRPMTAQEMKATSVLWMDIEEATAKVRAGPPGDPEDADFPVWAGVLPIRTHFTPAEPAPDMAAGIELPEALARLIAAA